MLHGEATKLGLIRDGLPDTKDTEQRCEKCSHVVRVRQQTVQLHVCDGEAGEPGFLRRSNLLRSFSGLMQIPITLKAKPNVVLKAENTLKPDCSVRGYRVLALDDVTDKLWR